MMGFGAVLIGGVWRQREEMGEVELENLTLILTGLDSVGPSFRKGQ